MSIRPDSGQGTGPDSGTQTGATVSAAVTEAVTAAFREEWGRVVATLIRVTGDWDLAEECAGGVRRRPEAVAERRNPRSARRVVDHRRPADGPQPVAPLFNGIGQAPGGRDDARAARLAGAPWILQMVTSRATGCG